MRFSLAATSSRKSTEATPEADDLAAEALGDVYGIDAVAEGLGEGAALFVEGPAGGGDPSCRGALSRTPTERSREEWNQAAVLVSRLRCRGRRGSEARVLFRGRRASLLRTRTRRRGCPSLCGTQRRRRGRRCRRAGGWTRRGCTRHQRLLCGRDRRWSGRWWGP